MDFSVPSIAGYVAAWLAMTAGIWKLFDQVGSVASADTRTRLSEWLRGLGEGRPGDWAATFLSAFDTVFGERALSIRRVVASSIASLCSVLTMVAVWAFVRPSDFADFLRTADSGFVLFGVTVFPLLNLVPDYVSLAQTRWILGRMAAARATRYPVYVVLDGALTLTVAITAFVLVLGPYLALFGDSLSDVFQLFVSQGLTFRSHPNDLTPAVFVYSTFFTSAWVGLYALSALTVRTLSLAQGRVASLFGLLDVEDKPFQCVGVVANVMVTLCYLLLPVIREAPLLFT